MDRWDALWVGLKLLGTYFVVVGVGSVAAGCYAMLHEATPPYSASYAKLQEMLRGMVSGAVYLIGGLTLLLGAGRFAHPRYGVQRTTDGVTPPEA
ncbi:MAG TPA: hypothetical protein VKE74_08320 [Gemmataceae bacterium]|nr:hypothetical protein [Gemmataceae bacterium]